MPANRRYDGYGWDYGHWNVPDEHALSWYRRHAAETGGPVLELACGTGGLLVGLASDGHEVVGVDLSDGMLGQARRRLAKTPDEVARRVSLVRSDMRAFDLEQIFALAIVADNSLREVETLEGMRDCLMCIRRHLEPGGRVLVTERRFDPSRYPGGVMDTGWSKPLVHPETGAEVRRRVNVRLDAVARRIHGIMSYRTTHAGGRETTEDCPFEGPVLEADAYLELFAKAGFDAELFVGYEERADDGNDPMLCFVGRATATT